MKIEEIIDEAYGLNSAIFGSVSPELSKNEQLQERRRSRADPFRGSLSAAITPRKSRPRSDLVCRARLEQGILRTQLLSAPCFSQALSQFQDDLAGREFLEL